MKLYEVDHPYYCSGSNYRVGGLETPPHGHFEFPSWKAFFAEWGESDLDMNLVFRWDWHQADENDEEERFEVFWILQRKGDFVVTSFPVTRDEEPAIREWLEERYRKIQALWKPLAQ